jgi:hypothetical protein
MSKELKSSIYYFIRRRWYSQLVKSCDAAMAKKGKEPITLFWHAFGLGMTGNISECLRELETFQARKDLQYPVNLAMHFFHKRAANVDRDALASLTAERSIAEDVAVI